MHNDPDVKRFLKQHNSAMTDMAVEIMRHVWPVVLKHSSHTGMCTFNINVEGERENRVVIEMYPREDTILDPLEKVIS